jgi:alanine dehydrogenase
MTVLLDDDTVRDLLDPLPLVEAIEQAVLAEALQPSVVPERMNLAGADRFLRVMPAVVPGSGVMGLKTFFGGGGVGVRYLVVLLSIETGEVLSAMDACYLTAARTAATSAVAARAMGVKAQYLGVLGSGLEAEAHVRTFAALDDVREVKVFSPNPETRNRFAERLGAEIGVEVRPVGSAAEACADVEHLITATNTGYGGPIACESAWIPPGLHLTAIGSTHQDLRELETEVLRRADVLVFDADPAQIADESGDVRKFVEEGGSLDTVLQLDDLLQGRVGLAGEPRELTIFKSVGTALQDMVAAELAFRLAAESGAGTRWDQLAVPKSRR